jgi:hypothetical protein
MRKRLFYDPVSGAEFKQRCMKCGKISIMNRGEGVARKSSSSLF